MFGGARQRPSVHTFSDVPSARIQRSAFDRSHSYRTTMNAGFLVPVFCDEVLPGDTHSLNMSSFARLTTPIKPIFDNLYLESFFFFVPNRLIWANFKKFMGEQINPGDSISYLVPTCTSPNGGYAVNSLQDYMGLGTVGQIGGGVGQTHDNLFPRAYNLIYNEWFRDEDLVNSVHIDTGDGPDTASNYTLLTRNKRHDYFTSCRPWPQKGSTAVTLPLGTRARVAVDSALTSDLAIYSTSAASGQRMDTPGGGHLALSNTALTTAANQLYADLSTATAATINQIRQAFQIQRLLERDARGGTRYTEIVRSHFDVVSPDARLQRPEYLGGGSSKVNIYPVAQSSATGATGTPQGNMAAYGVHSATGHGFHRSFTEHGVIIGLVNVRADLSYQQGLDRMWSRQTRYDYFWPSFAHLGEQAVLNQEIYSDGSGNDSGTFGYQERYGEYRRKNSMVTGLFRSTASGTVDLWHLSEKFASLPVLGTSFINDNTATVMNRVLAVTTEPQFYFDAWFKLHSARPMPTYGIPGFIDRF